MVHSSYSWIACHRWPNLLGFGDRANRTVAPCWAGYWTCPLSSSSPNTNTCHGRGALPRISLSPRVGVRMPWSFDRSVPRPRCSAGSGSCSFPALRQSCAGWNTFIMRASPYSFLERSGPSRLQQSRRSLGQLRSNLLPNPLAACLRCDSGELRGGKQSDEEGSRYPMYIFGHPSSKGQNVDRTRSSTVRFHRRLLRFGDAI